MATPHRNASRLPQAMRDALSANQQDATRLRLVSDVAAKANPQSGVTSIPEAKSPTTSLPPTKSVLLTQTRRLANGEVQSGDTLALIDQLLQEMQVATAQVTGEAYARSTVNLSIALYNGNIPTPRVAAVMRFLVSRLDPRATPLAATWQRMLVRNFSHVLTTNYISLDVTSSAVAVILYHVSGLSFSEAERTDILMMLLVAMGTHEFSDATNGSVVTRVLNLIADRERPPAFASRITLTYWLALVLARRRVPFHLLGEVVSIVLIALRSKAVADEDRGKIGWALSYSLSTDNSVPYPAAELNELAHLQTLPEQLRAEIQKNINLRTVANYSRAFH